MGLVVFPLIPLFFTGPFAAATIILLLKRDKRRLQLIFWLGLIAATLGLGILIAYTFSYFFPGPGCFITLFTPASAIVTLLYFRFQAKDFYQAINHEQRRRRWFQAATLLVPLLQLSAPLVGFGYAIQCDVLNRRAAQPIIAALETYKNQKGHYPVLAGPYQSNLEFLVPRYLSSIPPRACAWPFKQPDASRLNEGWSLYFCHNSPGQETLLLVPTIGTDIQQIYNPQTGAWSRGGPFDGYCP